MNFYSILTWKQQQQQQQLISHSATTNFNRKHDQTWYYKRRWSEHFFDPNIETFISIALFGTVYKNTEILHGSCIRQVTLYCVQLKEAERRQISNDFTTVGNRDVYIAKLCVCVYTFKIEWKVNFYEWNENDNAYSLNGAPILSQYVIGAGLLLVDVDYRGVCVCVDFFRIWNFIRIYQLNGSE